MKFFITLLLTFMLLAPPVYCETEQVPKKTWAQKHPKLAKAGKKIKKACEVSMPVLQALSFIGTAVGGFSVAFRAI